MSRPLTESAGVLGAFTGTGKKLMVEESRFFLEGMTISIWRPTPYPEPWLKLCERVVRKLPTDERGRFTNEIVLDAPPPDEVRPTDVLICENPR